MGASVLPTAAEEKEVSEMESFEMPSGKTVYLYVPQRVKDHPEIKVPMVLFMCGTTCDPVENLKDSGWIQLAEEQGIIVISPDYNNYATYSETPFLISVVEHMIKNYPVDSQRIYSTGFSNGGAASVALTRDYPQYFAAISAMGWMVDLDDRDGVFSKYDMPFQVVQGDGEFTDKGASGAMEVMEDEKKSIQSLMLYNEMLGSDTKPDYEQTPYWGYAPDSTETIELNGRTWQFSNYLKEGFQTPFAQLIIVEDSEHRPRPEEAAIAWAFFEQYRRDENGQIVPQKEETMLNLTIGDTILTATLADNSSAQALRDRLSAAPITIDMQDYGSMEKVGSLGVELPRNDEQITTEAGDLILYQGSSFVIYYAPNSWNFTRLGKINDITAQELKNLLGDGSVSVTLSLAQGETPARPQEPSQREYKNLAYDTLSSKQTLDLYLPETGDGPFPLLFFIHGGGWFAGDKTDGQEIPWLKLRQAGYAVASVNYRLSGEAAHPAGIQDCKTALRFLKANAETYCIDPQRIASAGGSSGGHYALMLALTAGNPDFEDLSRGYETQDAEVACCVAWYPATDLAETMRTVQDGEYTGFGAQFAWDNISRYVGKTITDVKDSALVNASPVHYISEDMPPILLQHGNADTIAPMDQSQRFLDAAVREVGEDHVSMDVLKGAEHGDSAFGTDQNMKRVQEFLDQYLK